MEDEPRDTCFGAGSVAGAVIGTFLTTILLLVVAALLYRQWRRHKGEFQRVFPRISRSRLPGGWRSERSMTDRCGFAFAVPSIARARSSLPSSSYRHDRSQPDSLFPTINSILSSRTMIRPHLPVPTVALRQGEAWI